MFGEVQVETGSKAEADFSVLENRGHWTGMQAKIFFLCTRQVNLVVGKSKSPHLVEHKSAVEPPSPGADRTGQNDQGLQAPRGGGHAAPARCSRRAARGP